MQQCSHCLATNDGQQCWVGGVRNAGPGVKDAQTRLAAAGKMRVQVSSTVPHRALQVVWPARVMLSDPNRVI